MILLGSVVSLLFLGLRLLFGCVSLSGVAAKAASAGCTIYPAGSSFSIIVPIRTRRRIVRAIDVWLVTGTNIKLEFTMWVYIVPCFSSGWKMKSRPSGSLDLILIGTLTIVWGGIVILSAV